jgi:hypothetical protein
MLLTTMTVRHVWHAHALLLGPVLVLGVGPPLGLELPLPLLPLLH